MSLAKRLANQKTKWTASDCMDAASELSRLDQVEQEFQALKKMAAVPDVDALAQFIRMTDGAHQMGSGALAERICEWLRSARTAAQAPECKTCDGAGGWERANSSTSYSWKDCPDCTAQKAVVDLGAENHQKSPETRADTRVPGGGKPQPVGVVEAAVRGAGGFHVRLSKGADMPRVGAELYLQQVVSVVQQEPVAGQSRFTGEPEWRPCNVEHVRMVQSERAKWPDYEVRLLAVYDHPASQAECAHSHLTSNSASGETYCHDCGAWIVAPQSELPGIEQRSGK
jgi:hypothetical protein